MRKILVAIILLATLFHSNSYSFEKNPSIETVRFILLYENAEYFIFHSDTKNKVKINKEWLEPPGDQYQMSYAYVSPFYYDSAITSFEIKEGVYGLHLSSYGYMQPGEGSAQAGCGTDIFLIYNSLDDTFCVGLNELGITKERERVMGCLRAKMTHFLLSDMNDDNVVDIGVVEENLLCNHIIDRAEDRDYMQGPLYAQEPIKWHVYTADSWNFHSELSGEMPKNYVELPLIGINLSPVDVFASIVWRSYNPHNWKFESNKISESLYIPKYRIELIEKK
jgi:hypothetical protein